MQHGSRMQMDVSRVSSRKAMPVFHRQVTIRGNARWPQNSAQMVAARKAVRTGAAGQVRLQGDAVTDRDTPTLCRDCANRLDDTDRLMARNHRVGAQTARYGPAMELVDIAAA